jgi:hypothetical protein
MPYAPEKRKLKRPRRIVSSPPADSGKASTAPFIPDIQRAINSTISLDPLQLLAVILKTTLCNRISDEEVHRICSAYYSAVLDIWSGGEE